MIFAIHVSDCLNHTIIITTTDFEIYVQTIDLKLTLNLMEGGGVVDDAIFLTYITKIHFFYVINTIYCKGTLVDEGE